MTETPATVRPPIRCETVLDVATTTKRRSRSTAIQWDAFIRYARTEEINDVCAHLREMIAEAKAERCHPTSAETGNMPMSLKPASDGGWQLSGEEKTAVSQQLGEAHGPANVIVDKAALLVQIVGPVVSSYTPGGDGIAYIHSAEH